MTASYQHYATHDESEYPHLWRGVVGAWAPCLGPSGTRLHDHSGRANWGTLTNMDPATDWVVDGGRYALDFDGVNDFILAGPTSIFGTYSLSVWIKKTSTALVRLFGNRIDGPFRGIDIYLTSANEIAVFTGSNFATSANRFANNVWQHFVINCGPFGVEIFVNGMLAGSTASNFTIAQSPQNIHICRASFAPQDFFAGLVDDVIFCGERMSQNNALELYQIGRGGMYTPRRRRRAYSFGPSFLAAWARGSNVLLQPCGVS